MVTTQVALQRDLVAVALALVLALRLNDLGVAFVLSFFLNDMLFLALAVALVLAFFLNDTLVLAVAVALELAFFLKRDLSLQPAATSAATSPATVAVAAVAVAAAKFLQRDNELNLLESRRAHISLTGYTPLKNAKIKNVKIKDMPAL
jgi:hypothetical protein